MANYHPTRQQPFDYRVISPMGQWAEQPPPPNPQPPPSEGFEPLSICHTNGKQGISDVRLWLQLLDAGQKPQTVNREEREEGVRGGRVGTPLHLNNYSSWQMVLEASPDLSDSSFRKTSMLPPSPNRRRQSADNNGIWIWIALRYE